jgi:hypothetical protein
MQNRKESIVPLTARGLHPMSTGTRLMRVTSVAEVNGNRWKFWGRLCAVNISPSLQCWYLQALFDFMQGFWKHQDSCRTCSHTSASTFGLRRVREIWGLTTVNINITVLRNMTPCSFIDMHYCFGEACCLKLQFIYTEDGNKICLRNIDVKLQDVTSQNILITTVQ